MARPGGRSPRACVGATPARVRSSGSGMCSTSRRWSRPGSRPERTARPPVTTNLTPAEGPSRRSRWSTSSEAPWSMPGQRLLERLPAVDEHDRVLRPLLLAVDEPGQTGDEASAQDRVGRVGRPYPTWGSGPSARARAGRRPGARGRATSSGALRWASPSARVTSAVERPRAGLPAIPRCAPRPGATQNVSRRCSSGTSTRPRGMPAGPDAAAASAAAPASRSASSAMSEMSERRRGTVWSAGRAATVAARTVMPRRRAAAPAASTTASSSAVWVASVLARGPASGNAASASRSRATARTRTADSCAARRERPR